MDAALFTKMLSDKNVLDLRGLGYQFPQADIKEFTELLKNGFYHSLPLKDFSGQNIVYLSSIAQVRLSAAKVLLMPQNSTQLYGVKAMEEEIVSTFTIEQVDFTRDSVRKILSGLAPTDESESRIFGMKKGLEFISDPANQITEETIHQLYEMTIGAYLSEEDRLLPGHFYRHDSVYVVGAKVEHMLLRGDLCHHLVRILAGRCGAHGVGIRRGVRFADEKDGNGALIVRDAEQLAEGFLFLSVEGDRGRGDDLCSVAQQLRLRRHILAGKTGVKFAALLAGDLNGQRRVCDTGLRCSGGTFRRCCIAAVRFFSGCILGGRRVIRLLAALAAACGIGRFSAAHAVSDLLQYVIIGHGGEVPVLPVHGAGGVDPGREDLVNVLIGNLIVGERLSCWNIRDQLRGGGHAVIGIGCGLFQVILISSLFVKWCVFPRGKCDRTCEPGRKNTVLRNIFENHS